MAPVSKPSDPQPVPPTRDRVRERVRDRVRDRVRERVRERVVVVTGSEGGIGAAIAAAFVGNGETVVGLDLATGFDVADPGQCAAMAEAVEARHGRIDVVCNNAGISAIGDVVTSTPEEWERVFAVNVFGVANVSRAFLPGLRRSGSGAIVNTCSVAASVGLVERAVYSASKGAILALTKAMAADEVRHGVRVNCVSPGTVASPWVNRLVAATDDPEAARDALRRRQPLGDLVSCEAVAAAVVYLAAATTYTTGSDFLLDGGITGVRIVT